ncbi:hypothetical protein [Cohnella lupini]|uniref:Uncharacterized protein n=1 Tax=Cohnella lupini TaxID=1294267 RepID=A0A3D9IWV9_9BACL|nr:hypothetical protein [Cohnella lupini]RED66201.1 hypothetical protein DFP95_101699 [Cohnella lupini]
MLNKMLISFAAVLFGFMSLGFIKANTTDYSPVPRDSDTRAAYVDRIYQENGKTYIDADFIDWYEGEEANKVFREREQDPEMTETPDGYYIVNDDTKLTKLEIADDAKVFMQLYNRTGNIEEADIVWNEKITADKFLSLFADDSEMDMKQFPYHLTVENGIIVKITQQYIP